MPKPHSEATKQQARQLYEQRGAAYAAEQLSLPIRTIRYWANQEHWRSRLAAVASGEPLAARQRRGWAIRRAGLRDHLGEVAEELTYRLQEQVRAGKVYRVRDMALAVSVLIERAESLHARGGGELEPEAPAEQRTARLVELVDVVEQREASGGG